MEPGMGHWRNPRACSETRESGQCQAMCHESTEKPFLESQLVSTGLVPHLAQETFGPVPARIRLPACNI